MAEQEQEKQQTEQQPDLRQEPETADRVQELEQKLQEQEERFIRLAAEYDNFRKRSAKEKEGVYADATLHAVKEILPVIDNFERALAAQDASAQDLRKGLEMTFSQFRQTLEKLGVEAFGERGDAFDPLAYNAVMHVDDESLGENEVAQVLAKGYKLGDRIVRHAVVQVAN